MNLAIDAGETCQAYAHDGYFSDFGESWKPISKRILI